jgi:hypothetical protein
MSTRAIIFLLCASASLWFTPAARADWPHLRGPNYDGVSGAALGRRRLDAAGVRRVLLECAGIVDVEGGDVTLSRQLLAVAIRQREIVEQALAELAAQRRALMLVAFVLEVEKRPLREIT